jgi:alpha-1,3-glucosyltransferase
VLLPLLPVTLLADSEPGLASWMPVVAAFSMYPLLRKDGLSVAYLGALLIWAALTLPASDEPRDSAPERPKRAPAKKAGGRRRAAGAPSGHGSGLPDLATWARRACGAPDLAMWARRCVWMSLGLGALVHVLDVFWTPPARYPFLVDYMVISLSFLHIAAAAAYLNWRQWNLPPSLPAQKVD